MISKGWQAYCDAVERIFRKDIVNDVYNNNLPDALRDAAVEIFLNGEVGREVDAELVREGLKIIKLVGWL